MAHIRKFANANQSLLLKTASYYVMHITVAMVVAYAVTGSFGMALTLSLLEPTIQAVAFFFHERAWTKKAEPSARAATPSLIAV